jgi:hypothetical protein
MPKMTHYDTIQKLSPIYIRNNIGEIDACYPFYLFGPQPVPGSFLDFSSNEWLNKNVTQITFQLNWVKEGLPKNFASYYEGYSKFPVYHNASFKVNFSIFYDGNWQLLPERPLSLFEENKKDNTVLSMSTFYLQVNKKLFFTEQLEIAEPSGINDPKWECFFRMELVEPNDGFGHRLFPELLPKALIWNSRRWSKKIAIPSFPYTPVVEKIDVSMTYLKL